MCSCSRPSLRCCSPLVLSGRPWAREASRVSGSLLRRILFRARGCSAACGTSFCSEALGQASVEAAAFIPVIMLLLALLLQPAFLLYTRSVMQQAAAEGVRVLATREVGGAGDDAACEAYVKRRLRAVPDVAAFHTGEWEVELSGDSMSREVRVGVEGRLRPLPLLGVLAQMLGEPDGDEVVLRVEVTGGARPDWLEGGYGEWVTMWD